jgi:membrane-bound metal-dependent hydrolase YbcI (DUF457 family)
MLKIVLLVLIFITALYTKEYRGEHQDIIASHIGGVFYVLFGALLFSVLFPALKPWQATLLALGCTSLLEFIQYFRFPFLLELTNSKVFLYLLGNNFNPVDFLYYFFGAGVGFVVLFLLKPVGIVKP